MFSSANSRATTKGRSELGSHRSLIWQFTLRNVELRHKGSHLGLAWSFISPLLLLALYVFVFGFIFKGSFGQPGETQLEYALGIFLGLSLFHFLGETIGQAPGLITSNPNFVKKVVFPLQVLPAAAVGASLIHLTISLALIFTGIALFGPGLSASVLLIPIILLPLALLGLGLAWLIAALGVFFRDIAQITQFVSVSLMFASAVFYPVEDIPAQAWVVLKYNPLLLAIELCRDAVLWRQPLDFRHLGVLYLIGALTALVGSIVFRRLKPAFADVL